MSNEKGKTIDDEAITNPFDDFSSKIKRLYIPLPNYQFFHQPYTPEADDTHFVGRRRIIETLKSWLSPSIKEYKKNPHGVYLITGFRGMGKSSVVGKTIQKLVDLQKPAVLTKWLKLLDAVAMVGILVSGVFMALYNYVWLTWGELSWGNIGVWSKFFAGCVVFFLFHIAWEYWPWRWTILHINVSVSDKINSERDVLALIAGATKDKFEKHIITRYPSTSASLLRRLISLGAIFIVLFSLISAFNEQWLIGQTKFFGKIFVDPSFLAYAIEITGAVVLSALVYMFLVWGTKRLVSFWGFGHRLTSARYVMQRLQHCCDRINVSIRTEQESSGGVGYKSNSIFVRRKHHMEYPFATVREIEADLIQIFEIMNHSWLVRTRLFVVIDELDKLVVESDKDNIKEPDIPEFAYTDSGLPGGNSYRVKKHNLLYMLGQLKTFLSSARAKFIFIAGRELYDSYKENADREYSIYMFDQILNIDSFFTYDSGTKDVTRMTERYLCRQLLEHGKEWEENDENWKNDDKKRVKREQHDYEDLNLSQYYAQCKKMGDNNENDLIRSIVFLRHFVTFLTFVSNGAPKKITNQLERYVINRDQYKNEIEKDECNCITINDGSSDDCKYYLSFGHYDQQKINFINYMVHPVFRSVINPASEYGDKHLVAASFMLGHIFKHHNGGFSMQNLEYVPELIENTKTPELREFLRALISFLSQIHINKITTGLYDYKFNMKIYEEISFFSKRSELISGIFNFSRDYSLAVKQYFNDVLSHHAKQSGRSPISLANIHLYLGDLHMDSEEYSEAISHFDTSKNLILRAIKEIKSSEADATLVARLTRAMLKLGLAYEKRNSQDLAYLTYCELVTQLVSNRFFDESKFGLDFRLQKTPAWNVNNILIFPRHGSTGYPPNSFAQIRPPFVEDVELPNALWSTNSEFTRKLTHHLTKESSALISKISIYEDLRVAYTPLLAKLFSIEKQNAGGITLTDLAVTEAEFRHLFMFTNSKEKYILSADFFRKLGDILYYKNSDFGRDRSKLHALFDMWDYDLLRDAEDYCQSKGVSHQDTLGFVDGIRNIIINDDDIGDVMRIAGGNNKLHKLHKWYAQKLATPFSRQSPLQVIVDEFCNSDFNRLKKNNVVKKIPDLISCHARQGRACHACKYYDRSLAILSDSILPPEEREKTNSLSKGIAFLAHVRFNESKTPTDKIHFREKELLQAALSLEAMANVQLSCHNKREYLRSGFLDLIMKLYSIPYYHHHDSWIEKIQRHECNAMEKSFAYYLAAAEFYDKAGDTKSMAQCISKVIHAVSILMPFERNKNTAYIDFINMLRNRLLPRAIGGIQSSYDFNPLHEMPGFKDANDEIMLRNKKIAMDITSNSPDSEEVMINLTQIFVRQSYRGYCMDSETLKRLYDNMSLTYNRLDSLSYNRIRSLFLKNQLNGLMLCSLFDDMTNGKIMNANFNNLYDKMFGHLLERDSYAAQQAQLLSERVFNKKCAKPFELVEFLIADSIFCLSNIVEYITPTFQTTLFTNNFYGDVYKSLLEWVKVKERYEQWLTEPKRRDKFKCYLHSRVDRSAAIDFIHKTYLAEMALKYYTKSVEINTEGQAYQDFIVGMTIVDDDLQNDTCQFYLALERHSIRSGNTERKMNEVRMFAKDSGTLSESASYSFDRYWGNKDV